jgi:hypothetical protein
MKGLWYWLLIYVLNVPKDEVKEFSDIFIGALCVLAVGACAYLIWFISG